MADVQIAVIDQQNTQIAVIDQQNTQIALAAPSETEVTVAVPGVQGPAGEGVPSGGTANQVLFKQSGTDYDTAWSSVTSAMIGDLEIVNADVSASAAIAGTKISPDFGAQNVTTTGTATAAALIPSGSSVPTNGVYLPSANNVAISTAGTGRLFVDASGRVVAGGDGTIGGTAILGAIGSTSGSIYGGTLALVQGRTPPNGSSLGIINFGSETNPAGAAISSTAAEAWTEGSSQGSDLQFLTTNTGSASAIERLRITSDGKLGVGTSAPSSALEVSATAPVLTLNSAAANASSIVLQQTGTTYGRFRFDGTNVDIGNLYVNGATIFNAGGGEKARIDSSGRLLVGTSTGLSTVFAGSGQLQVVKDGINAAQIFGFSSTGQDYTPCVELGRARGTQASPSAALNADWLGSINFYGHDGTQFIPAAYITARADGTTGTNDMPGRLVFSTTADGSSSPTERMRIDSSGRLLVGTTTASGANLLQVNSDALIYGVTVGRGSGAVATNVAVGGEALNANTTGSANSAVGYRALYANTTGSYNIAIGANSLRFNVSGGYNTATGFESLYSNTTGTNNVATGFKALYLNTTGSYNIATGLQALYLNTTGIQNVATGFESLYYNTTGSGNVATGYQALRSNTTGNYNVAIGTIALYGNTTGSNNTAIGRSALVANTTGTNNTAFGYSALWSNTTGSSNAANGYRALYQNTTGSQNVANGVDALYANTTGVYNIATGYRALFANTTGSTHVAIGYLALTANTTGYSNVAVGGYALQLNTTGIQNVAFGESALKRNTTGNYNCAIGHTALDDNTTGVFNVANGYAALSANTTGNSNTANGGYALYSNTTGGSNVGTGWRALYSNTTGVQNNATGFSALNSNTTGSYNVADGYYALYYNTTGDYNSATGHSALFNNTTGYNNIATGSLALYSNTTGFRNVAIGHQALYLHTTGAGNNAVGYRAGYFITTASNNSAFGYQALYSTTTGGSNTAIGSQALYANTTGTSNTATGYYALVNNTTGSNNTATGTQALASNTTGNYSVADGFQALFSNTTGNDNVAISYQALYANTTGANNTAIGSIALYANTTGSANNVIGYAGLRFNTTGNHNNGYGYQVLYSNTTGNNNVAYGTYGLYANTTGNNNIAIGYTAGSALTTGSNNVIIGGVAGTAGLADTMIFGTGDGTERFRVDSSGRLGLGSSAAPGGADARMWIDQAGTNDYGLFINASGGVKQPTLWLRDASATLSGKIVGQSGLTLATGSSATAALTIDASQRVGVGTTNPGYLIDVGGASQGTPTINCFGPAADNNWAGGIRFASNNGTTVTSTINASIGGLLFDYGGTERARIDSSGRLGIGTTSPAENLESRGTVRISADDYGRVDIIPTVGNGGTAVIQQSTSSPRNGGDLAIQVDAALQGGNLLFRTGGSSERARIDTSGRLLVGTSAAFSTSSNALIQAVNTSGGEIVIGRDFALGTDSTVGSLAFFANPGTVAEAARIEAVADALHVGGAPTRLVFSTTASAASAATERARITSDGYLRLAGGGIQFNGDTAAANALDDYEEGTWTPTAGTFSTWTSPTFTANYVKVGNVVTVSLRQTGGTIGWGSAAYMGGLPYTPTTPGIGYAGDTYPTTDNGPILIWTNSQIFFQTANASEGDLVLSATYLTS